VVAAEELALVDPAFGELGVAVWAAVVHGDGLAFAVEPEDKVATEKSEGFGAVLKEDERDDGIPEFTENGLAGDEHGGIILKV
jgi:hypothetical protein